MSEKQDADGGDPFDFTVVYFGRRIPISQRGFSKAASIPGARIITRESGAQVPGSLAQHQDVNEGMVRQHTEEAEIKARSGASERIREDSIHGRRHVMSLIREIWQYIKTRIRLTDASRVNG
jgi:hypothetical protein